MPEGVQLCPKAHFGYMVSGKMKVMMPDTGEEKVIGAGDVSAACECRMAVDIVIYNVCLCSAFVC